MKKIKIFWGDVVTEASDKINEWIENNPDIEILDWQYQQSRYSYHSICVCYVKRGENNE